MLVQLLQEQVSGPVTFIGEGENQTPVQSLLYNALFRGRNARPLPRPFILVVVANPGDVEKSVEFAHEHKLKVIRHTLYKRLSLRLCLCGMTSNIYQL